MGWQTLADVFCRQIEGNSKNQEIFSALKNAVVEAALLEHQWDAKAFESA